LAAVCEHYGVFFVQYIMLALSFVWIIIWSLSIYGIGSVLGTTTSASNPDDDSSISGVGGFYYFLLLISFYWTLQVFSGICNVTIAGVVGCWWFQPKDQQRNVVSGSFYRATTSSLGSIAFGALIVAILQALKQLANEARKQDNGIMVCIAACILGCIENLMQYFNRWAFTYIGIYGYNFTKAGSAVWDLFTKRGMTAIIDDNLISNVLGLGCFMVGLLNAGLGYGLSYAYKFDTDAQIAIAICGFLAGYLVTEIMMTVIYAAVAAVLVCFIEDPSALQVTHPDHYADLCQAWISRFGRDVCTWIIVP